MIIAGGIYLGQMLDPSHHAWFGSGLRAAAAVRGHLESVQLHAYVGKSDQADVEAVAASYRIDLRTTRRKRPIEFAYLHSTSEPTITPPLPIIEHERPI